MKVAVWAGFAALVFAGQAAAETWHPYSRSPNNAYMADADSIVTEGEITSIKVATVSRTAEAGDLSHSIETYQFRCATDQWRTAGLVELGPDGAEMARYPEEGAEWEPVRRETMPAYLKAMACDGARAVPPHWPTIQAFIEAGRP